MKFSTTSLYLLTFFLLLIGFSCQKDEVTLLPPCQGSVTKLTTELLIGIQWQVEELRFSTSNKIDHYKRGASGNTVNYDTHYNVFAKDGTGNVWGNGNSYPMTWKFSGSDQNKIAFSIKFPNQTIDVIWENIELTESLLKYTEYYTQDGYNILTAGIRTPRK